MIELGLLTMLSSRELGENNTFFSTYSQTYLSKKGVILSQLKLLTT